MTRVAYVLFLPDCPTPNYPTPIPPCPSIGPLHCCQNVLLEKKLPELKNPLRSFGINCNISLAHRAFHKGLRFQKLLKHHAVQTECPARFSW